MNVQTIHQLRQQGSTTTVGTTSPQGNPPSSVTPASVLRLVPGHRPDTVQLDPARIAQIQVQMRTRTIITLVESLLARVQRMVSPQDPLRPVLAAWAQRFGNYSLSGHERIRTAMDLEWLWHEPILKRLIEQVEEGEIDQIQRLLLPEGASPAQFRQAYLNLQEASDMDAWEERVLEQFHTLVAQLIYGAASERAAAVQREREQLGVEHAGTVESYRAVAVTMVAAFRESTQSFSQAAAAFATRGEVGHQVQTTFAAAQTKLVKLIGAAHE